MTARSDADTQEMCNKPQCIEPLAQSFKLDEQARRSSKACRVRAWVSLARRSLHGSCCLVRASANTPHWISQALSVPPLP